MTIVLNFRLNEAIRPQRSLQRPTKCEDIKTYTDTKSSIQETYNFVVRFETHLKISDLVLKNIILQLKPTEYDLKKKHNFKQ